MMNLLSILFLAVGPAMAQNLSGQPQCASACIASAVSAAGCAATDMACQCGPTQAAIGVSAAPCLLASCTALSQLLQAQSAGSAQCARYSATLTAALGPATAGVGAGSGSGGKASTTTATSTATSSGRRASSSSGAVVGNKEGMGMNRAWGMQMGRDDVVRVMERVLPVDAESEEVVVVTVTSVASGWTPASTAGAAAVAVPAVAGAGALLGVLGVAAAL